MAPSSARRRRGTFAAFRRPFITDPIFWLAAVLAVALGVVVSGAAVALGGRVPDSALAWGVAILVFAIAGWLSFKLLAMGLNTSKALEEADVTDPKRAASLESKGRSAGAIAGRGAAALRKQSHKPAAGTAPTATSPPPAAPAPAPTSPPSAAAAPAPAAADPAPEVTVDKAARVFGSMVGRRLADRRKDDD